ncbi:MAG: deoxyribodipyrimidine photo-lyase [Chloroflexi bacterium]|nr:MAG: deoxyribodipyrimidine photo-lyase [Chloroflexota bacterium]MBL1194697.1 deoxyribodipyrimidine photo-lyase [Chloroflexota bacterium]NOH11989.1 deoxyribodipyrimidine photo-lyase [Chloroflexota bacterium]
MRRAIWWLRRDLRLVDNSALQAALDAGEEVIPLFIRDPFFERSRFYSEKRATFHYGGLESLDNDLRQRGGRLIVRSGKPAEVLKQVMEESGAEAIFAKADHSPYARRRDESVGSQLPLELVGSTSLRSPDEVLKGDGEPYIVYTPFMRRWKELPLPGPSEILPAPERINTPDEIQSEALPEAKGGQTLIFPPSEQEAQRRLEKFIQGNEASIYMYDELRNRMDVDGTSQLSPYLRFGMLSARQAVVAALKARDKAGNSGEARRGAETWLNELIWREFYISILYHYPHVLKGSFREKYDSLRWRNDEEDFAAWRKGRTGYPVVDAAMRQLATTGWMHNRARMIAASFLVKNLLIDWRWGEEWFMQHLVDGDPANNNGGWQWTAGTGTDAAPYFRVFNPILQSKKFDPDGFYIRRWVPELVQVRDKYIHTPWEMPVEVQREANCEIGKEYPRPIVDVKVSRQMALDAYAAVKKK